MTTNDTFERYRAFVATVAPEEDGYLFDAPRCRFWPEPGDELVLAPGATALGRGTETGVAIQLGGAQLPLRGINFATLQRALSLLPCSYAKLALGVGPEAQTLIAQTFSKVLFAPSAVAELELRQRASEIVRFPGSPYEVVRSYWRNIAAIGDRLEQLRAPPDDSQAFRALLLELHRTLLLGAAAPSSAQSFYLPASSLARKRVTPGVFYETETGVERRGSEVVLTRGARVSVPLLGGESYWQLLAESVSDEGALASDRAVQLNGLELGRLVQGRAAEEPQSRPWFLPPRPLLPGHFDALLHELRAAWRASADRDLPRLLRSVAGFHYRWVRMHPLPSANQSLSMSFVNLLLRRRLGVGVPHLLLDQLALRFQAPAYAALFGRAVNAWCAPWPTATDRLRNLLRMRSELNEFVSKLGGASSLIEARGLLIDEPEGARLALLS